MNDQRELLATIGEVVVNSASLEYAVAVLVALTEGCRDQECEDRALAIVKRPGQARKELRRVADHYPDRRDIRLVLHDVASVLDDRHVIAHSIPLENTEVDGEPAIVIYHPRSRQETTVRAAQLREHVQDIRIAYKRVHALIGHSPG